MTKQTFIQGELVYYAKGIDEDNIREVVITSVIENNPSDTTYYFKDRYGTHLATDGTLFKTLRQAKDRIQANKADFVKSIEKTIETPDNAVQFLWENNKEYLSSEAKLVYKRRIEDVLNVTLN